MHRADGFLALVTTLCFLILGISQAHAAQLNIGTAKYDAKKSQLKVSGGFKGSAPGTTYSLFNDDTGDRLGTVVAGETFQFLITNFGPRHPPCSVRVEALEASAVASVKYKPANCSEYRNDVTLLELSGTVRDEPIPYATIYVTIGGYTFTTVADENGNFVIEIAGIDLSSLVLIESVGVNPADETSTVDMVSIAGTLEKLVEDADGDGVVDGTENPNINNTPYTTALFVLLGEANGGETPTTLEELETAERSVDATELLELAAVIKLIVDEGFELPIDPSTGEPYETIIGFLADAEVDGDGNTPVDNFIAANDAAIETAVVEILTDNDIIPAFTTEGIPDRYYWLVPAQVGFLSRYGQAFDFQEAPQTGKIRAVEGSGSGVAIPGEFNWQVTNGQLVLDWTVEPTFTFNVFNGNASPIDLTLRCRAPDEPQFGSCSHTCQDYVDAWAARTDPFQDLVFTQRNTLSELTKYAVGPGGTREFASQTDIIAREIHDLEVDYDGVGGNPPQTFEFCDEIEPVAGNVELLDAALNPPKRLEVEDFAGNTMAVRINYDPDDAGDFPESLYMDFVTFVDDTPGVDGYRSTTTLLSGASLEWRIVDDGAAPSDTNGDNSADGNELQFRYPGGVQQSLKQLEPMLGPELRFWSEVSGVPQPYGDYDMALWVDPGYQLTEADLVNDTGEFWNAVTLNAWRKDLWTTNQLGQFELVPGASFGWEFSNSNSSINPAYRSGFNYGNQRGISWRIETAPLSAGTGQLQLLPAGTVTILRHNVAGTNFVQYRYWIPIAESLVSVPGDVNHAPTPRRRLYILEQFYDPPGGGGTMRVAPRINAQDIFYTTVLQ